LRQKGHSQPAAALNNHVNAGVSADFDDNAIN
jgi:hypothetical protein